jgi:hypothetical protein
LKGTGAGQESFILNTVIEAGGNLSKADVAATSPKTDMEEKGSPAVVPKSKTSFQYTSKEKSKDTPHDPVGKLH